VRRVKTNLIWYGAGCLVLAVGLVGLLGLGGYGFARWRAGAFGISGAAARAARWDGRTPLRCAGNDQMTVRGVTAALPSGAAIVATDNCVLTMDDVNVTAHTSATLKGLPLDLEGRPSRAGTDRAERLVFAAHGGTPAKNLSFRSGAETAF
jgi:hypothetical protein